MKTRIRPIPSRRRARPIVEGLEVRQVPTAILAQTALVLLNPEPLPPRSSRIVIQIAPGPIAPHHPPGPI
jgi:hypothetical protein